MSEVMSEHTALWQKFEPEGAEGIDAGEFSSILEDTIVIWRGNADNCVPAAPQTFEKRETVHIIRGSATVTMNSGEKIVLNEGDFTTFSEGTSGVWEFGFPIFKLSIYS